MILRGIDVNSLSLTDRRTEPFVSAECRYINLVKTKGCAQRILAFALHVRSNKRRSDSFLSCGAGHPQSDHDGDDPRGRFYARDLLAQVNGE